MRRLGMKGGSRRKSETSSDADSGENGGSAANDAINSDAGNNDEQPDESLTVHKTPVNKKRARGRREKRDDDAASTIGIETPGKMDNEPAEDDGNAEDETTPDEQENGDAEKASAKKRKREKPKAAASTSQEKEDEYEVEKIVAHRTIKGRRQFLVRWKGYNEDSDSWEQDKDLNCPKLIENFLADEEIKQEEENIAEENEDDGAQATPAKQSKIDKKTKRTPGKKDKPVKANAKTRQSLHREEKIKKEDTDVEETSKEFEVEKIIEVHFKKNKTREFLIRWKGFASSDDTWEPEENLNCPELIEKFMEKVRMAKISDVRELRMNPTHTKRYIPKPHESGRRWSRRHVDKQRTTYYQNDE